MAVMDSFFSACHNEFVPWIFTILLAGPYQRGPGTPDMAIDADIVSKLGGAMPVKDHLLQRAKELTYRGRPSDARRLVLALLKDEPDNEAAWLCYGETFPDLNDRLRIYERALQQGTEMPRIQRAFRQVIRAREQASQAFVPVSGVAAPAMPARPGNLFPNRDRSVPENENKTSGSVWRPDAWIGRVSRQPAYRAQSQAQMQKGATDHLGYPAWMSPVMLIFLGMFILLAIYTVYRQYQINQQLANAAEVANIQKERLVKEAINLQAEIQLLQIEKVRLLEQLTVTQTDREKIFANLSKVTQDLQGLQTEYEGVIARFNELEGNYSRLLAEHQTLAARNNELKGEYENLAVAYNALVEQKRVLEGNYNQLQTRLNNLEQTSIRPPYIAINNRTVHLAFKQTNGAIRSWDLPFEMLEESIEVGFLKRGLMKLPFNQLSLKTSDGVTYHAPDFRVFVDPDPFRELMSQVYRESSNEYAFLNEVLFIVSQLTTYSGEFNEVPRMPLETLLAGGGDCEDTAILYASMIKAAPVDWKVSMVLMNGNNPYDRHNPDHVAVRVDTGKEVYIVETTDDGRMTPYESDQLDAWFFEIQ